MDYIYDEILLRICKKIKLLIENADRSALSHKLEVPEFEFAKVRLIGLILLHFSAQILLCQPKVFNLRHLFHHSPGPRTCASRPSSC